MTKCLCVKAESRKQAESEPWAIMHPRHLSGTPEALADEEQFRQDHPGRNLVLIQVVDCRNPKKRKKVRRG